MAMRAPAALEPPRRIAAWRRSDDAGADRGLRLTPARRRVLDVLADGPPRPTAELAREAGVGVGVVKALAAAGALVAVELPRARPFEAPDPERAGPTLTRRRPPRPRALSSKVAAGGFAVTAARRRHRRRQDRGLFRGDRRQRCAGGQQVLVLLPEIALGAQWLDRFAARFGVPPAQWHSDLTAARAARRLARAWRPAGRASSSARARRCSCPFADLGLIVVDEEHDAAYKQEDGVIYQARDMAVVRARLTDIPIVLVSATPSLETVQNVAERPLPRAASAGSPRRRRSCRRSRPSICAATSRRAQSWLSPTLRRR